MLHIRKRERHGMAKTPEYKAWEGIIERCLNPRAQRRQQYQGRGITVCDRWRTSFVAFFADMGARPSALHSIDRIDNDKGYEPGNCRWATPAQQVRNTQRNLYLEHNGRRMVLADWSRETGINFYTLRHRYLRNLTSDQILAPVVAHQRKPKESKAK